MPCIPIPKPALPTLSGINLTPPLPQIALPAIPNVCCLPPPPKIPPLPLPLPPLVVNPAFVAELEAAIETVENFVANFELDCPRQ